jgi:hypothetical protein
MYILTNSYKLMSETDTHLSEKILMSPLAISCGNLATFYPYGLLIDCNSLLVIYYRIDDLSSSFILFYLIFPSFEFHRMMHIRSKWMITILIYNLEWNRINVLYIFCITTLEILSSLLFIAIF